MRIVDFLGGGLRLPVPLPFSSFAEIFVFVIQYSGEAFGLSASRELRDGQCVERGEVTRHSRYGTVLTTQTVRAVLGRKYHNAKLFVQQRHV